MPSRCSCSAALQIWGWGCVPCVWQPQQGTGKLLPRAWLWRGVPRVWPQLVLLPLGSTEGHQAQPRVTVTAQMDLCSPRSLSWPAVSLFPAQPCFCSWAHHPLHVPLTPALFASTAAQGKVFKLHQM